MANLAPLRATGSTIKRTRQMGAPSSVLSYLGGVLRRGWLSSTVVKVTQRHHLCKMWEEPQSGFLSLAPSPVRLPEASRAHLGLGRECLH